MSQHAQTFLFQARTVIQSGDPRRGMDLLRRAKLMASGDPSLMMRILDEMVRLAPQAGCEDEAGIWQQQLSRLQCALAPAAADADTDHPSRSSPVPRSPVLKWTLVAVPVVVVLVLGGRWFWQWSAGRYQPVLVAPGEEAAARLDQKLDENVGLVLWIQRYEGFSPGRSISVDLPLGNGTAFAVSSKGYMLTNRHVADGPAGAPQYTGDGSTMPTMTRIGAPFMLICFGSDPKQHYRANVEYKSKDFDLAVLKVSRDFANPLKLSYRAVSRTDQVIACGFPGVVIDMAQQANPSYLISRIPSAMRTGTWSYQDQFPPDVYEVVVTKGIIGAANRSFEGVLHHQFDAKVGPGNSGGPLVAENGGEVIGIVTSGGPPGVAQGYNFALALGQLRSELSRYLP